MVKFEDIKVGDVVRYDGRVARVMEKIGIRMDNTLPIIKVVGPNFYAKLHPSNVLLIESIELPQLKVGNRVHVDEIPQYERRRDDGIWLDEMDAYIGKEYLVTELWNHSQLGPLAKLNGWWFRTYHLSKVSDYDII